MAQSAQQLAWLQCGGPSGLRADLINKFANGERCSTPLSIRG